MKTDKYLIKYIPEMQEEVRSYYPSKFNNEFDNSYFDFIVEDHPDGLYYSILIRKKELK